MRRGDDWSLMAEFEFTDTLTVELWDLDRPPLDPHDFLGYVQIHSSESRGIKYFDLDGASYRLHFEQV